MEPITNIYGFTDIRDFEGGPEAFVHFNELGPKEMQPTFTLTFSVGTPMRKIRDGVIKTVLHYTRSNRVRAAQMLQISPLTIRRRLGNKAASGDAIRAA